MIEEIKLIGEFFLRKLYLIEGKFVESYLRNFVLHLIESKIDLESYLNEIAVDFGRSKIGFEGEFVESYLSNVKLWILI